MIRYIAVVHYHYDSTEPIGAQDPYGLDGEPKPITSYATREEAEAVALREGTGPMSTGYVWAVKV